MSSQSYKVRFNDQYRRFSLPFETTYFQLRKKIEEVFPELPSKGFQLYYLDEEQDQISVNSQTELDEAKRLSKLIIRLIVHIREQPANTQSQPQIPQNTTRGDEAKPSIPNISQNNSFVQMLSFIQPYLTNPKLLKTALPFLLSEMNKNNYIPHEEIEKLHQMGDQLLEYPAVQEFLSVKLPKLMQQVTGPTTSPSPSAPSSTTTTTASATEQIHDLVMPFVSMAQSFAQNLSQNINNEISWATKQEGSQPTSFPSFSSFSSSSSSDVSSNPEPKKPDVKETTSKPVYQPPPNFRGFEFQNVGELDEKVMRPSIPKPVPPPVQVQDPVQAPPPVLYAEQLKQLKELGFPDTSLLMDLLREHGGDINRVIDVLSDLS
jgi:hypothetical protein